MKATRLCAAQCSIPLPKPIRLGPVEITARDFVVLRLETDAGIFGDAIGYPRGSALLEEVRAAAPFFLGTDPHARRASFEHAAGRLVNARASLLRAFSLFDIALSDIAAKSVRLPLHRMLGAVRTTIPVMAVAGYYLAERSIEDVAYEVAALIDQGFSRCKIMLAGGDVQFDRRYAEEAGRRAIGRLAVDAHWSWRSLAEARAGCRALDDLGLVFIEDPFGAHRNSLLREVARSTVTPLAAGEDMPSAEALLALTDDVSYLRVDATTVGGFTTAHAVSEAAGLVGCAVLPHVFMPIHGQLAGCSAAVEMVEHIPESTGADPMSLLLQRSPHIIDGTLVIDQEPGAGIALDWTGVEHYAVATYETDLRDITK
ncbi:MAG: mandelate racemase/muconate lactonizing enzyme family protein [Sphingomonadaceae bacterium]